ncbi:MAG TPA: undecaprenyl-diphosphatase, partial [Campylobacterales bacterium]|nr:undecaprenyl-diphosphatase [Campylobacterales bacterium]
FSFLLAVPTMFAATGYDIYKNYSEFDTTNILALIVGFITSFFVAVLVIKWFLKFIQKHTFIPFGIYRILIGIIFLLFII